MSSMVQPIGITKPINPLKGGNFFKIIPLHIQTFTIPIQVAMLLMNL
jgi:hypothetical protein